MRYNYPKPLPEKDTYSYEEVLAGCKFLGYVPTKEHGDDYILKQYKRINDEFNATGLVFFFDVDGNICKQLFTACGANGKFEIENQT